MISIEKDYIYKKDQIYHKIVCSPKTTVNFIILPKICCRYLWKLQKHPDFFKEKITNFIYQNLLKKNLDEKIQLEENNTIEFLTKDKSHKISLENLQKFYIFQKITNLFFSEEENHIPTSELERELMSSFSQLQKQKIEELVSSHNYSEKKFNYISLINIFKMDSDDKKFFYNFCCENLEKLSFFDLYYNMKIINQILDGKKKIFELYNFLTPSSSNKINLAFVNFWEMMRKMCDTAKKFERSLGLSEDEFTSVMKKWTNPIASSPEGVIDYFHIPLDYPLLKNTSYLIINYLINDNKKDSLRKVEKILYMYHQYQKTDKLYYSSIEQRLLDILYEKFFYKSFIPISSDTQIFFDFFNNVSPNSSVDSFSFSAFQSLKKSTAPLPTLPKNNSINQQNAFHIIKELKEKSLKEESSIENTRKEKSSLILIFTLLIGSFICFSIPFIRKINR